MKSRRRKSHKGKFALFILIIIGIIYVSHTYISDSEGLAQVPVAEYKVIKEDKNENYSGIGQKPVKGKDGYFTEFTTSGDYQKTYKEYKQNGNASWRDKEYWDGTMEDNGCGITAIATILSGYGFDSTPEDLRKKYYPVLDNEKIPVTLANEFKIKNSGFYYDDVHLSEEALTKHLLTNRPVLICVWNKPTSNRWTVGSHYMTLLAADGYGKVYISNPNGAKFAYNSSGWYDFDELSPYIAKALYIESDE